VARQRGRETTRDMVWSLVILLAAVGVLAGFVAVVRGSPDPVREVDVDAVVETLPADLPFDVLVPEGLPEAWRATRADLAPGQGALTWRLSYVSPSEEFVGLNQSDRELDAVVAVDLSGFRPDGSAVIDGSTWERYRESGADADVALVAELVEPAWEASSSVAVVVGSGEDAEVESFVAALEPVGGGQP
jgi:hypothetical protein